MKFGGTSVSSLENWENILSEIKRRKQEGYSVCVVHSALSGISDKLEAVIERAPEKDAFQLVEEIKDQHYLLGERLGLSAEELLEEEFSTLDHIVKGIRLIG